ncbi:MAG: response regulator, partial [Proteobacteria bacterium]|nr:response regulator [Pseudomonadota bacterium]
SNRGTCFQLYFPVSKEKEVIQIETEKTEKIIGNGEHILIVDDEPQVRDIAGQMLQSQGYKVDSVRSGELAVEFVRKKSVDLIVIDMLMEPGMSGRRTYEEIIELYPDQKAIIASGFSENADVQMTLQLGAGGFIKKPYSMTQLGLAVKEALQG